MSSVDVKIQARVAHVRFGGALAECGRLKRSSTISGTRAGISQFRLTR